MDIEKEKRSTKYNLMTIIRNRESFSSDECNPEWKCTDFSRLHLSVLALLMLISYAFQLIGFIIAVIYVDPDRISFHDTVAIVQPYLEIFEMILLLFLVHFQFHALYLEPILILEVISRKMHYYNITISVLTTLILINVYTNFTNFAEILQLISLSMLLFFVMHIYYQGYIYWNSKNDLKMREILGFNILYSLSIPLIVIEIEKSIIIVNSLYHNLSGDVQDRVLISITIYFVIGIISLIILKDIYMGLSFCYNLLGSFIVQRTHACPNSVNCNVIAQTFAMIYSILIFVCVGLTFYIYPQSYRYQYKEKRFHKWFKK